jgi:hypothetical protein
MTRLLSFARPAVPHKLFDHSLTASRLPLLDPQKIEPPLAAPRQPSEASAARRQLTPARIDPHLNYSRFRDALTPLTLTGRPCPVPRFRFAATAHCQPSTVNRRAFEPDLNYSRSRDALALRVPRCQPSEASAASIASIASTANCLSPTVNRKTFEHHLNYSRSRDASSILHSRFTIYDSLFSILHPFVLACPAQRGRGFTLQLLCTPRERVTILGTSSGAHHRSP